MNEGPFYAIAKSFIYPDRTDSTSPLGSIQIYCSDVKFAKEFIAKLFGNKVEIIKSSTYGFVVEVTAHASSVQDILYKLNKLKAADLFRDQLIAEGMQAIELPPRGEDKEKIKKDGTTRKVNCPPDWKKFFPEPVAAEPAAKTAVSVPYGVCQTWKQISFRGPLITLKL